ncbi:MAG: ferric reductase-like transmembrane domain-containing protein [Steroidobacteraceae bacterium]|nr:ferric reductase-like transmembrane domain-containing protein [Steroidobacteraceae bacterium]MDW8259591.1 ferric reductase-like transmembrane domain-containing protein [Gammaproteobacteria bacterium]
MSAIILRSAAYGLLLLLPLLAAALAPPIPARRGWLIEFAVGLGFAAYPIFALNFALVARSRIASGPFGLDVLMRFHRLMALGAAALLTAHVVFASLPQAPLNRNAFWSGLVAVLALAVIIASSLWRQSLRLDYDHWRRLHGAAAL